MPQAGTSVRSVPKGATQQPRTPWQTKWLLLRAPDELSPQDASYCQAVCHLCPALAQAASLARRFVQMVRQRQHDQFDAWLKASQRQPAARTAPICARVTERSWSRSCRVV